MNIIDKLEKKFGRFAISNLMLYLIIFYLVGYVVQKTDSSIYWNSLSLNAYAILHGQVWRVVTFLMYPPSDNIIWLLLYSFIYYSLGKTLEKVLGTFRFNLYIFLGVLGYVLAAIIIYAIGNTVYLLTADYLYLTMLLALAATFPEMKFYLYFAIPVKAKWLGYFYGILLAYEMLLSNWAGRIQISLSLLNFLVFFVFVRRPVRQAKQTTRKVIYSEKIRKEEAGPRHHCAICGRTELDAPDMDFRYCSKCDGGTYEYCQDHLYTHVHVAKGGKTL